MAKAIEYGYPIGRLMEALIIDRYEFVSVDEDAITVRLVEPETAVESIETTLTESGVIKPTAHMPVSVALAWRASVRACAPG
jgi:hypothetical protein